MDKLGLGRKMEQAVMRRWERNGFTTWQPPRAKYCGQDLFDLFAFIAVKPWCPVNLVQIKRKRRKEAEVAFNAIKSFAEADKLRAELIARGVKSWLLEADFDDAAAPGRLIADRITAAISSKGEA